MFGVQTLTRTGRQDRGQQDVSKVLEVSSQAVPGLLGGPGLGRLVGPPGAAGSSVEHGPVLVPALINEEEQRSWDSAVTARITSS